MSQADNFTYAVRLAPGKSSFYDPISKCNLFLSRPAFGFNIEPTTNILRALKVGTLIDIKGNLKETDIVKTANPQPLEPLELPPPNEVETATENDKGETENNKDETGNNKGGGKNGRSNKSNQSGANLEVNSEVNPEINPGESSEPNV